MEAAKRRMAEDLNTPANFVAYARQTREAGAQEKASEAMRRGAGKAAAQAARALRARCAAAALLGAIASEGLARLAADGALRRSEEVALAMEWATPWRVAVATGVLTAALCTPEAYVRQKDA